MKSLFQKIKVSETVKVLIVLSIFLIVANVFLGIALARQSNAALKKQIDSRMLDITETVADMIDGDAYETVTERDENNPDYVEMYNIMKDFQDNIDLEFIYAVREKEDGTFYFTIDPAQVDCSEYGEEVKWTEALQTAANGVAAVDEVPYEDAYGRFYSAYSPLFNSKGEVVGVIAVDFSASYYDEVFSKNIVAILIGVLFSTVIGAVIIAVYSMKIRHREELEGLNVQANKMITALAADYRSVYYVELDTDEGICYRSHSHLEDGLKENEKFRFRETFTDYANKYIDEADREGFLNFITVSEIRERLDNEDIIAYKYLLRRNGKESYEMLRIAGVRRQEDRDDNIVHAIGIGFTDVDVETRKDIEQRKALEVALNAAEEANNAKTIFLSNMSHEIRTPMNAIIGLDSLALSEPDLSEQVKEYLVKIGTSANHLLGIINDILDMSRIESGRVTLKNDSFSLRKFVELISTMLGSQCDSSNITYSCKIDGEIDDYYMGDETKLKEIILNVLSNAVKYTNPGGKIEFIIKRTARFGNKATILFTMKDNGIGMEKDFIPKVFDAFSQEDITAGNKYGSTGLGMAITKNLVDMMNGKIEVESQKGVGTTCYVTLTFEIMQNSTETEEIKEIEKVEEPEQEPVNVLDGKRILVAEDMDINAQIIMKLLSKKGINSERAENGQIALEMFEKSPDGYYNAILMDMRMPVMNGLDATVAIRKLDRPDAKKIPIIALTANAFDEDVERSLQAGLDAHLSKPIVPDVIFMTLEKLIRY